jgi:hypothetical protein
VSGDNDLKTAALSFVKSELSVDDSSVSFKSGSAEGSTSFAYLKQSHENIPFANAVANVAMKDNKVVAFGSSFVDTGSHLSSYSYHLLFTMTPTNNSQYRLLFPICRRCCRYFQGGGSSRRQAQ